MRSVKIEEAHSGKVTWKSPSNIAIVKYWGKHGNQLPNNPSLSFTLDESYTITSMEYDLDPKRSGLEMEFYFEGKENQDFGARIRKFLLRNVEDFPYVNKLKVRIDSRNSFPHSAGIASSASSMSALAMCLVSIESRVFGGFPDKSAFRTRASHLARLASGSASRSVYGGLVCWGETESIVGSSDYFAVPVNDGIHDVYKTMRDSILIVDAGAKSVSSSAGHDLMNNHPYAQMRYFLARKHMEDLKPILENGDMEAFGEILETEALGLHALMMNSSPSYLLMKPGTLSIIERIREVRLKEKLPVYFTLDAGPNVHLIYPASAKKEVKALIESELIEFTAGKKVIHDRVGDGPEKLES